MKLDFNAFLFGIIQVGEIGRGQSDGDEQTIGQVPPGFGKTDAVRNPHDDIFVKVRPSIWASVKVDSRQGSGKGGEHQDLGSTLPG